MNTGLTETLALSFGRLTEDASDGLFADVSFCAVVLESFEKSDPPRLALPSNAPPTSTIAMTATTASARRQWDGAGAGAGAAGGYDPYGG